MHYKATDLDTKKVQAGPDDGLADGEFIVYPSTFIRQPDSHGDVIAKGAFLDSIRSWKEKGHSLPGLYGHRMDDPDFYVAYAEDMGEDDHGLWVRGRFDLESPKGRQVWRLVKGRRLNQLSFAYDIQDAAPVTLESGAKAQELRKLHIHEFSFVPVGSNQDTSVVAVKTAPVEGAETPATVTESAREDDEAKDSTITEEPETAKVPVEAEELQKSVPVERVAALINIYAHSGQKEDR